MRKTCSLLLLYHLLLATPVMGQELPCHVGPKTIRAYSVADENSIRLVWPANEYRMELHIARRVYTNRPSAWQNWTEIYSVTNPVAAAQASEYSDFTVSSGTPYEYRISTLITNFDCHFTTADPYWYYQHINTGIEVPLNEERGKLILLVESSLATPLTNEIARLQADLVGDGYRVIRHDVAANDVTNNNWSASVTSTKALIRADYLTDTNADWSIFIVGHVPIPYSGLSSPGGHTDNFGAHPADWYYADMDESAWTDTTANNTSGKFSAQHNVPGDGKFDQSNIPTEAEMRIGRIDLRNLPAFSKSEVELLRQYLDRNHAWRHKVFTVEDRGIINSNNNGGLIYRGSPHDSHDLQSSFFGTTNNTIVGEWLKEAASPSNSFLFAASSGNGLYDRDMQIGRTTDFAATNLYAVFTTMYGSYYGDWDSAILTNAVLLAPLAAEGYALSSYYHEGIMNIDSSAMGEPIGYELYAQAATRFRGPQARYYTFGRISADGRTFINTAWPRCYQTLMGDPTLRMRIVAPPTNVALTVDGSDNIISWTSAVDTNIQGYHVYRAPATNLNDFIRLTTTPVLADSFRDSNAVAGVYRYMVRTSKLELSPNRSFYNASQGILTGQGTAATWLSAHSSTGEGQTLRVSGEAGGHYTVEYNTNLSEVSAWQPLTNITLSETTGTISIENTNRLIFFRLKN